mmetsp:Transcript_24933/g.56272  ORF Transcript_24933/g.56272 Transcript_24933/m.56272 type:complete len:80 (+) Transcript_24933:790-1029(+)
MFLLSSTNVTGILCYFLLSFWPFSFRAPTRASGSVSTMFCSIYLPTFLYLLPLRPHPPRAYPLAPALSISLIHGWLFMA